MIVANEQSVLSRSAGQALARVRSFAGAAAAAIVFSAVSISALQCWASWRSWSDSTPITVSLGSVDWLANSKFQFETPPTGGVLASLAEPVKRRSVTRPLRVSSRKPTTSVSVDRVGTRELLLSLAIRNSEQVLKLWSHEAPVVAGSAAKPAPKPARALARSSGKRHLVLRDQVSTQAAAPVTTHPQRSLAQASEESVSPVTTHEEPTRWVPPPVATSAQVDKAEQKVERKIEVAQKAAAEEATGGRLSRLTRESNGEAWLLSSFPQSPSVLLAQTNSIIPRWLKNQELNTHSGAARSSGVEVASTQTSRGWISGWIPTEAVIRVKGAERIAYFAEDGSEVSAESLGEKFFVASKVPVGPAVVQLVRRSDEVVLSAAGAPVLAQTATQIDFRTLQSVRVRGSLWDSESAAPKGVAHAELKLVGFPNHLVISDADGSFDLGEIQLATGLGVFVEARLPGGFTHRYAVSSKGVQKQLSLFHFSDSRLHRWIEGLDGGVSAESGLVVASVSVEKAQQGRPVVKALSPSTKSVAETYWLDSSDRLLEPTAPPPLEAAFVQWIGVEVVGRSVLAGLQSPRGRWMESKWLPVSPGVVSVFSPEE